MNFYKRHIGDYVRDTAHLSLLEHGVYARLLDVYYSRETGIPDGQAARLIGARAKDEVAAVDAVIREFFTIRDGVWIQRRCEREIEHASAKAERNREIGKLGGRPRKEKPIGNPAGFQNKPTENPSQTPDSRLQKKKRHSPGDPPGFPEFYAEYPRKVARPDAAKAFEKQRLGLGDLPVLIAAIRSQNGSAAWSDQGGKFIPYPATWLNQRRWEDEAPKVNGMAGRDDAPVLLSGEWQ